MAWKEVVRANRLARHRGPDGEGYWAWDGCSPTGSFVAASEADVQDPQCVVALGHRRLAILDLSAAGLQPMSSPDRQVWLVFNGEVYNYLELREELSIRGYVFRTDTDTEVIIAAYLEWGVKCFERFNGMWGLGLVDLRHRKLVLSRDRLGIKPLYWRAAEGELAFASEIKQLILPSGETATANLDAVVEFIDTGYESPPNTFFQGIHEVPAGHWGEVAIDRPQSPRFESFWFPDRIPVRRVARFEAQKRTRELFEDSIRCHLRADVPIGVCLSGGLDSSTIFGQVQRCSVTAGSSISAFSAAFDDPSIDERPYIHRVVQTYDANGYVTFPSADDFLQDCDSLVYHHDSPLGSLSPYAAWSVMRLARRHHVPVLLNGQGGDELFSGYWPAYYLFLRQTVVHSPLRCGWHLLGSLLPGGNAALVSQALAHWRQYQHRKRRENRSLLLPPWQSFGYTRSRNWALDAQRISPEQYRLSELRQIHLPRLLKLDDRNSMAFGIEGRYPFLDYRLVEWILSLPPEMNLRRGWNKTLIRESLGHLLPKEICWRRSKIGFVTPQAAWIGKGLKAALQAWMAQPSPALQALVHRTRLREVFQNLSEKRPASHMDESQLLLLRLFLLDRWFSVFNVQLPSDAREPAMLAPTPCG